MANEFKHITKGTSLTQAEFEHIDLHACNNQATGDLIYASSASQLSRLGIGTTGQVLNVVGGIPAWSNVLLIGNTTNANMATAGITIDMSGANDEIFALKSSDVAHGMTAAAETDTFCSIRKSEATSGGMSLRAFKDADGAGGYAFYMWGCLGEAADTTKSTAGTAITYFLNAVKSGTGITDPGADANLVAIGNYNSTRFIFDNEGSGHADVEWVAYDKYDDLALVKDMESELVAMEDTAKTERRHALESVKIIGKDSWHMENGHPRAMVNFTKLAMLHHGALLQMYNRLESIELEAAELRGKLLAAGY